MNRLVLLCLIILGLVVLLYAVPQMEAFTDPSSSILPDDVIQAGQERFNKLMDLISVPNPQISFSPQEATALDQATNSPQFQGGLPGAYRMVGATSPYKIPTSDPSSIHAAQTICETVNTADCTAFQNPAFSTNCGISFDVKGKDSKGKPHIGGLYISADDKAYQQQQAATMNVPPDDLRYSPSLGTSSKGMFAVDSSSCQIISEKLQCRKTHDLTSPNCAQCFTSSDFHRIDPSTPRMPPSFIIQTNATSLAYVGPNGSSTTLQVTPDTPMPLNPATAEGDNFQIVVSGPSDGSLYLAGYLTSQTAKGAFNLDLNALISTPMTATLPTTNPAPTLYPVSSSSLSPLAERPAERAIPQMRRRRPRSIRPRQERPAV